MGEEVFQFEKDLGNYLGIKNIACVNTGTSALHISLQALGIGKGDEVLVPSLTFVATYQAISATGAIPISCDVEYGSGLLDLNFAEKMIGPKTKAILFVHYASNFGNLEKLYELAKKFNLKVVEDAAHSFGCKYGDDFIGSLGDVVCFSFDGIKNITSGEGGAIASKDETLIEKIKELRVLGIKRESDFKMDVSEQGFRYHMSNIMAAIGRVQLKRFEKEFKNKRISLFNNYKSALEKIEGIRPLSVLSNRPCLIIPHIMPVKILDNKRDEVRKALSRENIQTGIHYFPNHLLSKYKGPELPVTERLYSELLSLPLHPEINNNDIEKITGIIKKVTKKEKNESSNPVWR